LAQEINKILPESLGYKEFAKAVATILKDEYGSHNFGPFMKVLHVELGMEESLNEVEDSNIEKIDFAFVEGTTKFYGAYIYNKGSKNWDEKLRSSKEVQDFLTSLGIDIEFEYNNLPEIFKALEAKGIEAEDSEFDVS
jgi:CRISPR/Cas system-associated protein endoribonuclease Cas2